MTILIIATMEKEADIIIKHLCLQKAEDKLQLLSLPDVPVFYRHVDGHDIFLIQSGKDPIHEDVDSIGALIQLAVFSSLQHIKPDIIINVGTAGAIHAAGAEKHKVYLGSTAMGHDSLFPESDVKHKKLTCGDYPVPDESVLAISLDLGWAPISSTGSMLTTTEASLQLKANKAMLVDMEWKYIVYTILRFMKNNNGYKPRYMTIKISTDFIDLEVCPQEQFEESVNNKAVMGKLADACEKIIEKLCDITLSKESLSQPKHYSPSSI